MKGKIHFGGIDGLRTIACFGIIAMHIRENAAYEVSSFFYDQVITSWTQFVYLFFIISGFAMCAGYYDKFKDNKVNLNKFYSSRYAKTLPFFAMMILIEVIYSRSLSSLIEGLMELTLSFGLLPNNDFQVIGVGWFLGVIFAFYFMFPFFVFLLDNKKRAWKSFTISLLINYLCQIYFFTDKFVISTFTPRHSFIYCAPFLLAGGLIYLYLKEIMDWGKRNHVIMLLSAILLTILYYLLPDIILGLDIFVPKIIVVSVFWLLYAIVGNSRILDNPIMAYLSKISMEMYLGHMIIFRVIEKTIGIYFFGKGLFAYTMTVLITLILLIAFIEGHERLFKPTLTMVRSKIVSFASF